jgi:hypothetical protein
MTRVVDVSAVAVAKPQINQVLRAGLSVRLRHSSASRDAALLVGTPIVSMGAILRAL